MQITTIGLDIAKNVFQVHGRPIHAAASKVRAALRRVRCQLLHNGSWRRIDDDRGVYPTELLCDRCGLYHRVWLWRWRYWGTEQPGSGTV